MMAIPPWTKTNVKLTGKMRYRFSWNDKLIVQVEESYQLRQFIMTNPKVYYQWRDATFNDMQEIWPFDFKKNMVPEIG